MKNKNVALSNLISAYIIFILFLILIISLITKSPSESIDFVERDQSKHESNFSKEIVYVDRIIHENKDIIYKDYLHGSIREKQANEEHVYNSRAISTINTKDYSGTVYTDDINLRTNNTILNENSIHTRDNVNFGHRRHDVVGNSIESIEADPGLLNRRLKDIGLEDKNIAQNNLNKKRNNEDSAGVDFSQMNLVPDQDNSELGDFKLNSGEIKNSKSSKAGELYAYNYPSQGVGAGIGSSAIGAGAGSGAGLSAGIGEAMSNGKAVPALGGIGSGYNDQTSELYESSGVGGLIGGAGAGGAAGLTQGYIIEKLGIGKKNGYGLGGGNGGVYYKDLPKNGQLHIMMHVDGSGSILKTRKQLEIMKNTILKDALLPYYNNDESLYSKRVSIIDSSGERTLRFFSQAADKDNVLAFVFQDEAQPSYHLPNFNKNPEENYTKDLNQLKSKLDSHKGLYRGIMFQVGDKVFSRSFKEFVENAWQGQGYLKDDNLKKYHFLENRSEIKNKSGIVFSDEYHAQDNGSPEYYLKLIFDASKKVGIDLNAYSAGLTDGKHIKQ